MTSSRRTSWRKMQHAAACKGSRHPKALLSFEKKAYEELLHWEGLVYRGIYLRPNDLQRYQNLCSRYNCCSHKDLARYQEQLREYDFEMRYWDDLQCYESQMCLRMHQSEKRRDASDSRQLKLPRSPFFIDLAAPSTTEDDRHVMAKHLVIYPQSEELKAMQSFVNTTELALTMLADWKLPSGSKQSPALDTSGTCCLNTDADSDGRKKSNDSTLSSAIDTSCINTEADSDESAEGSISRQLCGVMRIGALAKGLLLCGETHFDLVLICKDKPTRSLLMSISLTLPEQLKVAAQDKEEFEVKANPDDATIEVTALSSKLSIHITLTSPAMRQDGENGDDSMTDSPADVLDRQKCLNALAAVRHAIWFQPQRFPQKSFFIVLRVMRDLCNKVHTWKPLQGWVIELLCEKAIMTSIRPLGPGESFCRVIEYIATGMLLEDKPGILDPCEKEPKDVLERIPAQHKEDITHSAQYAMRLVAFGQLHRVLSMSNLSDNSPLYTSAVSEQITKVKKRLLNEIPTLSGMCNAKQKKLFKQVMAQKIGSLLVTARKKVNQLHGRLHYHHLSLHEPRWSPMFTMAVDLDEFTYVASGPSKKKAQLHLILKVLESLGHTTGVDIDTKQVEAEITVAKLVKAEIEVEESRQMFTAGADGSKSPASSSAPLAAALNAQGPVLTAQGRNPVKLLNEIRRVLKYKVVSVEGANPDEKFHIQVKIDGHKYIGTGSNKKVAKANAALSALQEVLPDSNQPRPRRRQSHSPETVEIDGHKDIGTGSNKKVAKANAALSALQEVPPDSNQPRPRRRHSHMPGTVEIDGQKDIGTGSNKKVAKANAALSALQKMPPDSNQPRRRRRRRHSQSPETVHSGLLPAHLNPQPYPLPFSFLSLVP
uniref:Interleukin enhancer binding factor 3a n=1 Tax=Eptatretus burgeri TaxID=7764 RepID=A0A8C4PWT5_EPTBU